jgi:hypothetical protein
MDERGFSWNEGTVLSYIPLKKCAGSRQHSRSIVVRRHSMLGSCEGLERHSEAFRYQRSSDEDSCLGREKEIGRTDGQRVFGISLDNR